MGYYSDLEDEIELNEAANDLKTLKGSGLLVAQKAALEIRKALVSGEGLYTGRIYNLTETLINALHPPKNNNPF